VGEHPVEAVEMMNRVVQEVQAYHDETCLVQTDGEHIQGTTGAIAKAVCRIVQTGQTQAVAVYTATGTSARILAKSRMGCSILAMAPTVQVARRASLYYGVQSVQADAPTHTRDILKLASGWVKKLGMAKVGEKIVLVSGRPIGSPGATNTLVVHTID
jgi:pyruvate kinase